MKGIIQAGGPGAGPYPIAGVVRSIDSDVHAHGTAPLSYSPPSGPMLPGIREMSVNYPRLPEDLPGLKSLPGDGSGTGLDLSHSGHPAPEARPSH